MLSYMDSFAHITDSYATLQQSKIPLGTVLLFLVDLKYKILASRNKDIHPMSYKKNLQMIFQILANLP